MIELRPIDESNRAAVEALRVAPGQERFVSGVVESIEEAAGEPDGLPVYWAIYSEETPVGFVMITDGVPVSPGYYPWFLWKLLIDARFQRRGFGTATLDAIVRHMRDRNAGALLTSAGQGDGTPVGFYERYGFERTGDVVFGGELLLRLPL